MAFIPKKKHLPLILEFRRSLKDCEALYKRGGLECTRNHPDLVNDSPRAFVNRMLDLHRGLVIKVFIDIAHVDWHWSEVELELASELFDHVWEQHLTGSDLKKALNKVINESDLNFASLVSPFERLAPLRARIGDLQTVIMRIANIVAKADGEVSTDERRQLEWLQRHTARHLERIPLDDAPSHQAQVQLGAQAIQQLPSQSQEIRRQCGLATDQSLPEQSPAERLEESLQEVGKLIGLDGLKKEVHGLINFLKVQQERIRMGLPATSISLHSVYCGNPGTGKTTVARLVGQMFGAMGILKKGHLVETDRSGLVAEFAGQTGPKTNKRIDEALDGVLFIDEAYSLVAEKGDDPFGAEAVQALLKRMEDDRDRLVVILAGYPEQMKSMLRSNPGLSSRFNRTFEFVDYSARELGQIFQLLCEQNHYKLPPKTRAKLLLGLEFVLQNRDEHFGNGRAVRNIFESSLQHMANRIISVTPLTRKVLTTLEHEDIVIDKVPEDTFSDLDGDRRYEMNCPECERALRIPQRLLGRSILCKSCTSKFIADWGNPVN